MNASRPVVLAALGLLIGVGPARAQDSARARNLEAARERQAERIARQAEQIAKHDERLAWRRGELGWLGDLARDLDLQARGNARQLEAGRGPEVTEAFSRTLKLSGGGTFDLQNTAGNVIVTGGGGNTVRIDAIKRVRHPNESEGRAVLKEMEIQVVERADRIEVRTEFPQRRTIAAGVDFTVTVPTGTNVALRSVSGDLRVSNVNGELRMQTLSGDIVTSSVRALSQLRTVSGDIEIRGAGGSDVVVATLSGDILASALKTRGLDLRSVSGDIRLVDVEIERAQVRSVTGDIEYAGRVLRNGRYEFQSHSGDVRVTPAGNDGFALEASTFSGDVRSDFELTLQSIGGDPPPPPGSFRANRRRPGQRVRGTFGDGGAMLTLQSFSGDLVVAKR